MCILFKKKNSLFYPKIFSKGNEIIDGGGGILFRFLLVCFFFWLNDLKEKENNKITDISRRI